jgi:hypothetical protein
MSRKFTSAGSREAQLGNEDGQNHDPRRPARRRAQVESDSTHSSRLLFSKRSLLINPSIARGPDSGNEGLRQDAAPAGDLSQRRLFEDLVLSSLWGGMPLLSDVFDVVLIRRRLAADILEMVSEARLRS